MGDYTKSADRGYHRYSSREQTVAVPRVRTTMWHKVMLNNVLLSYGPSLELAQRHASRCGGMVVSSRTHPKSKRSAS